jgi:signal transduction histidine kinase
MQNVFRIEKLIAFNQTLEDKIVIATKQLRRSNEKLKALDEAKDEFISMASHQLRTPLTSIKGYISLILDGDMGKVPTKQKKMLQEAFSSSQRMVYLISDLLNVSRLKTGKFLIEPTDVYLPEVVEEEIDQVKEMAEAKNIKIHYEKPKTFIHLDLDEIKIRQVIMNFIDNAIHYTPEGGDINVFLEESGTSIKFTVVDSGIGVPATEQHHLFTKFYRAGNARKARPDGTGLGLFMAKKVIVASGGSIVFNSSEGKGSTFGFSFPKTSVKA